MIIINHEIVITDSKGFAKQKINLNHEEYLELVEKLNDDEVVIEEKSEDYSNYLTDLVFGRVFQ